MLKAMPGYKLLGAQRNNEALEICGAPGHSKGTLGATTVTILNVGLTR